MRREAIYDLPVRCKVGVESLTDYLKQLSKGKNLGPSGTAWLYGINNPASLQLRKKPQGTGPGNFGGCLLYTSPSPRD